MLVNDAVQIINDGRLQLGEIALSIARNQQLGLNQTEEQYQLQTRQLWTYAILKVLDGIVTIQNDQITSVLNSYDNTKLNHILMQLRTVSGGSRKPLVPLILNPLGQSVSGGATGASGVNGANAYLYVGYADDAAGSGYSSAPAGKFYVAFYQSNVVITPSAGTFTGLWVQFVGAPGANGTNGAAGTSQYLFQAWADDAIGTGFTLTFNATKNYTGFLTKTTNVAPIASDYTGLWSKYRGSDGAAGSNGTNGNTILSGVGAPAPGLGVNGDYYIDTADVNGAMYGPKALGAWGVAFNRKGTTGDTGGTGAAGTNGTNGANAYLYVGYADDAAGAGFTTVYSPSKNYIALKQSTTVIASPVVADFSGLWTKYRGEGGDTYSTTSTTSLVIGTGLKYLVVDKSLAYTTAQRVLVALNGSPANYMEGLCVVYDAATGQMTLDIDKIAGGGTFAVWDVNLTGPAVSIASQKAYYGTLGTDQGSGGANQALAVTPTKLNAFDTVVAQSAGMTASTANDNITVDNNGSYVIDFNATVSGTASSDILFQLYKNGVAVLNALARVLFDAAGNPQNVVIHGVQESVAQTDVFDIRATASAGTPNLKMEQGRFSVYTIGYINSEQYKDYVNASVNIGTNVADSFSASLGNSVKFDYEILKGVNITAGSIYAVWDGVNPPVYTNVGTISLGSTSDVVLSVDFSAGNIRLVATSASNGWTVKGKRTIIG